MCVPRARASTSRGSGVLPVDPGPDPAQVRELPQALRLGDLLVTHRILRRRAGEVNLGGAGTAGRPAMTILNASSRAERKAPP